MPLRVLWGVRLTNSGVPHRFPVASPAPNRSQSCSSPARSPLSAVLAVRSIFTHLQKQYVADVREADGGFVAECLTEPIFTQADNWEELRAQVQDAVRSYFYDRPVPQRIRLHLVRDELLATG